MTLYNPKPEIYSVLSELGYYVAQSSQNTFPTVPAITYKISGNSPEYCLDKELAKQDVTVTLDIWTNDTETGSQILAEAEAKMMSIDYRLKTSLDVPAPQGTLAHINATFVGIK